MNFFRFASFFTENFFDNEFSTILHEIYHVVGMATSRWDRVYDRSKNLIRPRSEVLKTTTGAKFPTEVILPLTVAWAKTYFNCPTITGVPLENGGGSGTSGAHWDKFIMGNDMMNPSDYFNVHNSGINFVLMDDLGYYQSDISRAEYLAWGNNAGCNIFTGTCANNPNSCTAGALLCSPDHYSTGQCKTDELTENCAVFHEVTYGDCRIASNKNQYTGLGVGSMTFGPGSRCVEGKIHPAQTSEQGSCLSVSCSGTTSVTVTAAGQSIVCNAADAGTNKPIGSAGLYIKCPNVAKICEPKLQCPNDCSNGGRCLASQACWCYVGHSGADCSAYDATFRYQYELIGADSGAILRVLMAVVGFSFAHIFLH